MARTNTKIAILEAAGWVVLSRGVAGLTLEAVAEKAGLSKGGLLYHFNTKDALIAAMIDRMIEVTEQRIAEHLEGDPAPGSWTRGYLRASTVDDIPNDDPTGRLAVALLATAATNPDLMSSMRAYQDTWRNRLHEDETDPIIALIVRLAADGLWMNEIFGIPVLSGDERREVLNRLMAMTSE